MISVQWLRDKFPDDDYAPRRTAVPHRAASGLGSGLLEGRGIPWRQLRVERREEFFIEEYTLNDRCRFVRNRPKQVMSTILATVEEGLRQSLQEIKRQPGSRGGRKPIKFRRYLLTNLILMWDSLGRDVSFGPKSDSTAFCETVAELIGWPSSGIAADIPRAFADLRNRIG
jgi:hypothetical protein